ncbi:hypothetical protein ABF176_001531 [Flavobacterium psychrophilum]|uniref:MbnP family protein n=1 Tax=Flavobacterium psychrophilum TaxID=96345 RepID=UPI0007C4EDDE|nr:MbnP family protein [Flavobacterium psychrophilum]ELY1979319.1 hypothetical protein [Flavobacterium psychrophilum]MCB6060886.1 hypothetical protein [Flavobacterium psychrophilum]OAE90052.1 hypothetical protein SU65_12975 [Flavobacterium psychrophilum]QZK97796.1 hypothetical protein K5L05_10900 [Flavobacterium psychrophilum]
MKIQLKKIMAIMALVLVFASCSKNEDPINVITGEGRVGLEFDNVFGSSNLILNTQVNTTSQGEKLKISECKYIVSNIVLTKDDGSIYVYPKANSYFIIDEAKETSRKIVLKSIPAGNYTKVTFGIGVDEAQFRLGATGQGDFLTQAQDAGMMWSWSAGYKFVMFEGMFTSPTATTDTSFMVHTGKIAAAYNYKEVTINFPQNATVRTTITPDVHIFADVAKIIDGTNKIKLSDNNRNGMGAMIMGGANLPLITSNLSEMFVVDHVHND